MTDENIAWLRYHICLDDPHVYNRIADALKAKNARIAELEAALKPFEEKSSKSLADAEKLATNEGYELPDDQTAEDIYAWALALTWGDLRAARFALNGEKGKAKGGP